MIPSRDSTFRPRPLRSPPLNDDLRVASFLGEWCRVADWFLACGFRNPPKLSRVVDHLDLDDSAMPEPTRKVLLRYIEALGFGRFVDGSPRTDDEDDGLIDVLLWALRREGVPADADHVREIVHAHGTDLSIWDAGRAVQECRARYELFAQSEWWLDDPRPIGDVVQQVYQDVTRRVRPRRYTAA